MSIAKLESTPRTVESVERPDNAKHPRSDVSERFRQDIGELFRPTESGNLPKTAEVDSKLLKDVGDRPESSDETKPFDDFAKKNGLSMENKPGNKLEFSLKYNGEKLILGTVDQSKAGFDQINKSVRELGEIKKWELEEKYGIKIAGPGDQKPRRQLPKPDGSLAQGKELELRTPNLKELLGIEAALEKGNPSQKTHEGRNPLKFYFLKDQSYYPQAGGAATYEPDLYGGPAIIVEPNSLNSSPITERDRVNRKLSNHTSIESLFIHELGHNSEENVFSTPQEKAEFYKRMGWAPVPGTNLPGPGEPEWMLKHGNGGFAPAGIDPSGSWNRINENGQVVGRISPHDVAKLATIKPSTDYFEGPHEMLAEGLTMFRLGDANRTHLMKRDTKLYNLIKEFDQREIDGKYGKGKFIRSFDGKLVPKTDESESKLKRDEELSK